MQDYATATLCQLKSYQLPHNNDNDNNNNCFLAIIQVNLWQVTHPAKNWRILLKVRLSAVHCNICIPIQLKQPHEKPILAGWISSTVLLWLWTHNASWKHEI